MPEQKPKKKQNIFLRYPLISIIIAVILILQFLQIPGFIEFQTRAKVARVKSDLRIMSSALEEFYSANKRYPEMELLSNDYEANILDKSKAQGFATIGNEISTPTVYLATAKILDPFKNNSGNLPYVYYTHNKFWIVISAGPDREHNINPEEDIQLIKTENGYVVDKTAEFYNKIYDPTNGVTSFGDIFRIKEGMYQR